MGRGRRVGHCFGYTCVPQTQPNRLKPNRLKSIPLENPASRGQHHVAHVAIMPARNKRTRSVPEQPPPEGRGKTLRHAQEGGVEDAPASRRRHRHTSA